MGICKGCGENAIVDIYGMCNNCKGKETDRFGEPIQDTRYNDVETT